MYIENDDFSVWMQKLYAKLEELCKDVRVLRNADRVLPEDDNLLDNQDLCLLFKVSIKTLQRYRALGVYLTLQSAEKCIPGFGRPGIHKGTVQFGNATQVRERTRFGQEVNR